MAEKEATIFIVDLGVSMGNCNSGRTEPDLDWAMRYVWDKITTIVAASRKTLNVGVLGLRTDETNTCMGPDEEGYEHISVLQELGPMSMTALKKLTELVKVSETDTGDAISAIVVAIQMITTFTKHLKYKRRIYLITDGIGAMDGDDLEDITSKINGSGIALTVLSVIFEPPLRAVLLTCDGWDTVELTLMTPSTALRKRTSRG